MEKFYTVKEVAERFAVKPNTVWGWVRAGKLQAMAINSRNIRISEKAIQDFLEKR